MSTKNPPIDRIDREIITALMNNARLSNKELAARVGLAQSTCLGRVRRLEQAKVLRSFHARVDPRALGVRLQAMISLRVRRHSKAQIARLKEHLMAQEEVIELFYLAGADDFLVHVAVRDTDHLRAFVTDQMADRREVEHLETQIIFEHARAPQMPVYGEDDGQQ